MAFMRMMNDGRFQPQLFPDNLSRKLARFKPRLGLLGATLGQLRAIWAAPSRPWIVHWAPPSHNCLPRAFVPPRCLISVGSPITYSPCLCPSYRLDGRQCSESSSLPAAAIDSHVSRNGAIGASFLKAGFGLDMLKCALGGSQTKAPESSAASKSLTLTACHNIIIFVVSHCR
jgi:hypothetical protein